MTMLDLAGNGIAYPTGTLDELGLDPDRVDELLARARRDVDDGTLPSCQVALARHGKVGVSATFGDATPDSRYIIFSCSKAVTASAVWLLIGDGTISVDDTVATYIPEFGTNGKDVVTIRNLLTHTGGFPHAPMGPPKWFTREGRVEQMSRWRLTWEPDSRYEYHSTCAHWVLAEIIERVTDTDYREFFAAEVATPLGIALSLGAPQGAQDQVEKLVPIGEPPTAAQLAALGIEHWDPGEVVNENLVILNDPANMALGVPGGGGVATAADLALFYQGILHNVDELWDPEVLELATSTVLCDHPDPLTGVPAHRTLGLSVAGDDGKAAMRGFGHTCSGRTFGHLGAGGQIGWVDPETGLSFAYLTNGLDAFVPNQWRRVAGLASKAAVCAP